MKKFLLASFIMLLTPIINAESYMVARGGVDWGGSSLGKIYFVAGDDNSPSGSHEVRAGGLFSIAIGGGYHFENFSLEGTLGYKFDSTTSDSGEGSGIREFEYSFERFPIEVGAYFSPKDYYRIGAGLSYHIGVNLELDEQQIVDILDDAGEDTGQDVTSRNRTNVKYDPALGGYVEIAYKATERTYAGLRYTYITYNSIESASAGDLRGDSIGLSLVYQY